MVNLDVDYGYTKTLNHTQKIKNLLKTERILKPKYKLSGGPIFTISLPGREQFAPLPPVNYATGKNCLRGIAYHEWLEKIVFFREYRVAIEPLAFESNSSQDPRFLLTFALPLKKS